MGRGLGREYQLEVRRLLRALGRWIGASSGVQQPVRGTLQATELGGAALRVWERCR